MCWPGQVWVKGAHTRRATIRFVGETSFSPGRWIGVELDTAEGATGKNNGSVNGVRYFTCARDRGLFVKPQMLELLESRRVPSDPPRRG